MKYKMPAQPLVFCFSSVSALLVAVSKIYDSYPSTCASLCLYNEKYVLAVFAKLRMRREMRTVLIEFGKFLGPGCVKYSFYEEHGLKITHDAISEMGKALEKQQV